MALAEVLFPPRAFPAESWCLGWMGAAEAEAVNPCRQCILFFIAHAWRLHHTSLWGKARCSGRPFHSCLHRVGVGDALRYNDHFQKCYHSDFITSGFLISWGSATGISAAAWGPSIPAASVGLFGSRPGSSRWGMAGAEVSWAQCLITGHASLTAHRPVERKNKDMRSVPGFPVLQVLTAGLGFTGFAQALWKSFLLKNLTFFRFLAELTQLLEPFTRSEPFRQCSPVPLLHANPPSRELPCSSSGCSSLLVLLCSYPLLLTALFP